MRVLLAAAVLVLAGAAPASAAEPDPGTITAYSAIYDVMADNTMHVTENITVDFPQPRHGIYRDFSHDWSDRVSDVQVVQDGKPADVVESNLAEVERFQIGSQDVEISGEHYYVISYTVADAVQVGVFDWQLISDWALGIESAHIDLSFPGPTTEGECTLDSGDLCQESQTQAGDGVVLEAESIRPHLGMHYRTFVHMPGTDPGTDPGRDPSMDPGLSGSLGPIAEPEGEPPVPIRGIEMADGPGGPGGKDGSPALPVSIAALVALGGAFLVLARRADRES